MQASGYCHDMSAWRNCACKASRRGIGAVPVIAIGVVIIGLHGRVILLLLIE